MTDKWHEATRRMIEKTEKSEIEWRIDKYCGVSMRGEAEIGLVYTARLGDKTVAVYDYRLHQWDDDGSAVPAGPREVNIEFIDKDANRSEWTWPAPKNRYELLEAVKYQKSDAENFLNEFLAE